MKCSKCQNEIREGATFCVKCGTPVKKEKKRIKPIHIIIIAVCAIILVGGGIFAVNAFSPYNREVRTGYKLMEEGKYEEAIVAFDAAIEIDDKKPRAYVGKATSYAHIDNKLPEVIDTLATGYEKTKSDEIVDAYCDIADIYEDKSEPENAEELLVEGYAVTEDGSISKKADKMFGLDVKFLKYIAKSKLIKIGEFQRKYIKGRENYPPIVVEPFEFEKGVLGYNVNDFDNDGDDELLIFEVSEGNNLFAVMCEERDGEVKETARQYICEILDEDWPSTLRKYSIFYNEYNGKKQIFLEAYLGWGIFSDGLGIEIKGYTYSSDKFISVLDLHTGGSDPGEEEEIRVNREFKNVGFEATFEDIYFDDASVTDFGSVSVVARITEVMTADESVFSDVYDYRLQNLKIDTDDISPNVVKIERFTNDNDKKDSPKKEKKEPEEKKIDLLEAFNEEVGEDYIYYLPDDYDDDGKEEAFVMTSEYEPSYDGLYGGVDIWFVSSKGECTLAKENTYGGLEEPITVSNGKFISWCVTAGGSGTMSIILGCKDGEVFEPKVSGKTCGFGDRTMSYLFSDESDFDELNCDYIGYEDYFAPEGGHIWDPYAYDYNPQTREFEKR